MWFDGAASTTRTGSGGFSVCPFRLGPARSRNRASALSHLPTSPCRGGGTLFWIYTHYCPQCRMERWGRTFKNEMLEGPGWFNHDTGEEFEGRELLSQASIDGLPAQPARP